MVERRERDLLGMDVTFVRPSSPEHEETMLFAQLKSTSRPRPDPEKGWFGFQFSKRDHFDRLAMTRSTVKAVLLVMVTDPDQSKWSDADHESLSVRKCCYWVDLEGQKSDAGKPTVRVPTDQIFSAAALQHLLDRIERDEPL